MPPKYSKKSPAKAPDTEVSAENLLDNPNELFPVVGIGASAGGLEAFIQLLSHLPIDTGMAFIIVQHMSPDQESLLSLILSRSTGMPVGDVQEGIAVAPNQVYVIPPSMSMTIVNGVLKLKPRGKARGQFRTVDTFLLSLAQERGNKAIGVVLSGSDTDGARGMEAIKAAGGITFAQSQDSAQVDSMPNTAIATGQIDFILPPDKIAEKIAEISRHPYIAALPETKLAVSEDGITKENALAIIFSLLRMATGVDFTYYKQTTLSRRIQRRMLLYKVERLEDYAVYLQNHPTEVMALYQDVLITVTSFFRDSESFEALKRDIFPQIIKDKSPKNAIRIWVAGCSTGEEAYSIAICLLEFLGDKLAHLPIQIYATDISETGIEYARTAFYTPSQVADVTPERLHRFFVEVEGGYQISKRVRELCVFARQNLISDPPFSQMDLISCRNVMIYLKPELQKKLLPIFHYSLKPTGFLMLGVSETVGSSSDLFTIIDKKNKLYARKLTTTRLNFDFNTSNYPQPLLATKPLVIDETLSELEIQKAADRIILNQYAPVGVVINNNLEILQFRGQTSAYLELPPGKASFDLLKMAKKVLRLELRTAIQQAKQQKSPIRREGLQITEGDIPLRQVNIDVIPFQVSVQGAEDHFLILFAETPLNTALTATKTEESHLTSEQRTLESQENERLQRELKTTKGHLQAIIEEQETTNQDLRAANEEILSSNEELQSMNEELQTAKEEIQATNEELKTINDELHRRNFELTQVSNDLQNLLSSINIPILMLGGDLRIRRFTPAIEGIFNLILTDIGRPLGDITHKLNLPDLEAQILEVIRTLNIKVQEIQDQDGHWYDLRIRPYRTLDDKIDGVVVTLVDIHELKSSSERLLEARKYAEIIVETVQESLLVLNSELQVITANRSFYETFQVLATQTEQQLIFDLGNGQWNIPRLRSLLEGILTGNAQFQHCEVEHNFEQIGTKTMLLHGRKMPVGDTSMILLVINDITEQKRLETAHNQLLIQEKYAREAAEAANRAKDEFLSVLSHELWNPLNAMIGWTQLLRTRQFDKAKTEQALETIERSAKAQAHLIEDILDISRITTGKFRLNPHTIELAPLIRAAIDVVRLAAEAKNIQLEARLNHSLHGISGDPNRLQQVIWNLLSNAIKFTPPGGRIEVTLDYLDNQAQIQVRDTGQGIHPDFLPYVFDRFRQADVSRTRTTPGLGLGLSIVRHIIELHGGTVGVESPGEEQGATFTVSLPLQIDSKETALLSAFRERYLAEEQDKPIGEIPSLAGVRVLVVDDDADIRQLFSIMLDEYGVAVTAAASVKEALSIFKANPGGYDVILSDIGMPGQDGYSLIRQIRALSAEEGGQIPAAAITAYARDQDRQKSLAAGFQIHVAKPVDSEQLAWIVANLSGRTKN